MPQPSPFNSPVEIKKPSYRALFMKVFLMSTALAAIIFYQSQAPSKDKSELSKQTELSSKRPKPKFIRIQRSK